MQLVAHPGTQLHARAECTSIDCGGIIRRDEETHALEVERKLSMYSRREFLRIASLAGSAVALKTNTLFAGPRTTQYFGLNDFIESHPDAVFILKTNVDAKTNSSVVLDVGYQLGQSLFVGKSDPEGNFPVTANIAIKPNITSWSRTQQPSEQTMGIQTDANFVEGIIKSLKDLTVSADTMHIRDGNYSDGGTDGAVYRGLATRTGVNLKDLGRGVGYVAESDLQWIDVPDGVWFKRIPYLWPVNSTGSCLINISKFKSHSMGMTLCSKNLQGTNAQPYIAHCTGWGLTMGWVNSNDIVANAFATIQENYNRHKDAGIPRWDLPGTTSGGLWMETHSTRCLDNNSVLHPCINIVEGVYGREGPFISGPADNGGYGKDIMTNIVIFGKNARHVDIIGTYLAGHEPGNFGFFHMAVERGQASTINPGEIPLYSWKPDGSAESSTLDSFARIPIRTLYLRKAGEEQYHMVNEAYDYSGSTAVAPQRPPKPDVFALSQNFPNPFNPSTTIQYYVPRSGDVLVEVFDMRGVRVATLVDGTVLAGDHAIVWNASSMPSGTYFLRLFYDGFSLVRKVLLIR
jgi:uncharacterized protein (DUF362 family)